MAAQAIDLTIAPFNHFTIIPQELPPPLPSWIEVQSQASLPIYAPIIIALGATALLAAGLGIAWLRLGPKVRGGGTSELRIGQLYYPCCCNTALQLSWIA